MKIIDTIQEASPRVKARIAGLFDLLEALTSGLGQVIIPGMLIVSGNAAATAANVLAHGPLFRLSILLALLGVACHIAWTYLFYELFKAVNRNLSLLAVFFSLVAMALQAFSSTLQAAPLVILEGGPAFAAFTGWSRGHALRREVRTTSGRSTRRWGRPADWAAARKVDGRCGSNL